MSRTVTCSPRVEFDPDRYPRIRVWDPRESKDRYLYLHRLTAYAHGELDSLWADSEVHHVDGDRWNNRPDNLATLDAGEHAETTRAATDRLDATEVVGVEYGTCPRCDTGRPHERLVTDALRCVVCGHPTERPEGSEGEKRRVDT